MRTTERKLSDLHGIGKAMLKDFDLLEIFSVAELSGRNGDVLYRELEIKTGSRQDPCVLDVFRCAVAQARNPQLPREQCNWWWWSRERLAGRVKS